MTRIVHLGIGAFHRAHQAWYTQRADDGWSIAGFTGRTPQIADALTAQGNRYALIERGVDGDRFETVTVLTEARDGADVARLCELIADEATAVVSLTITETGYLLDAAGKLREKDPVVVADVQALTTLSTSSGPVGVTSALARLLQALEYRRRRSGAPVAVVPCDNVPSNGAALRRALIRLAELAIPDAADWIEQDVAFVSTSVDRITPATTDADRDLVAAQLGWVDRVPVVTEPFTDWVLEGGFPLGRPAWERAGARFVDEVRPYEQRKLLLLNGAHSLLAYLGQRRGHSTVAGAFGDPRCRAAVEQFWDEAERCLPAELGSLAPYRTELAARFDNRRVQHLLSQIASDDLTKLRLRIAPVARTERAAGRSAAGCARAIASWAAITLARGVPSGSDTDTRAIEAALGTAASHRLHALVALIDRELAEDGYFMTLIDEAVERAEW